MHARGGGVQGAGPGQATAVEAGMAFGRDVGRYAGSGHSSAALNWASAQRGHLSRGWRGHTLVAVGSREGSRRSEPNKWHDAMSVALLPVAGVGECGVAAASAAPVAVVVALAAAAAAPTFGAPLSTGLRQRAGNPVSAAPKRCSRVAAMREPGSGVLDAGPGRAAAAAAGAGVWTGCRLLRRLQPQLSGPGLGVDP
jgi:hypothetical protein